MDFTIVTHFPKSKKGESFTPLLFASSPILPKKISPLKKKTQAIAAPVFSLLAHLPVELSSTP
ncbi:MAG: hypothetical protein ACOYI4_07260, partial [Christensenellales bacterium]